MLLGEFPHSLFSLFSSDGLITSGQFLFDPCGHFIELLLGWAFPFLFVGEGELLELRLRDFELNGRGRGNEGEESGELHLCFVCLFINYLFSLKVALNRQIVNCLNG